MQPVMSVRANITRTRTVVKSRFLKRSSELMGNESIHQVRFFSKYSRYTVRTYVHRIRTTYSRTVRTYNVESFTPVKRGVGL